MNEIIAATRETTKDAFVFQIGSHPADVQTAVVEMHIASDEGALLCGGDAEGALFTADVDLALSRIADGGVACAACCVFAEREAYHRSNDAQDNLRREIWCGAAGFYLAELRRIERTAQERHQALSAARLRFAGTLAQVRDRYDAPESAPVLSFDPDGDEYAEERGGRAGMEFERVWGVDWEDGVEIAYPDPRDL